MLLLLFFAVLISHPLFCLNSTLLRQQRNRTHMHTQTQCNAGLEGNAWKNLQ
uniref:Uncharacterized protein n=1 Tax=Anguilla anguilla TaxID=7936 RepID=A0A0E9VSI2_ANGAN